MVLGVPWGAKMELKYLSKSMPKSGLSLGTLQAPIWDHFETILGAFWDHLETIFERFGVNVGPMWVDFQIMSYSYDHSGWF